MGIFLLALWLCSLVYIINYLRTKPGGWPARLGPLGMQVLSFVMILLLWEFLP